MSLTHLYTDVATILRSSIVTSATRQISQSWLAIASNLRCEIQPRSQNYPLRDSGFSQIGSHYGFFELGTDIERGDRIQYTDKTGAQFLLDVLSVKEYRGHHVECNLDEVKEEESTPTPGS